MQPNDRFIVANFRIKNINLYPYKQHHYNSVQCQNDLAKWQNLSFLNSQRAINGPRSVFKPHTISLHTIFNLSLSLSQNDKKKEKRKVIYKSITILKLFNYKRRRDTIKRLFVGLPNQHWMLLVWFLSGKRGRAVEKTHKYWLASLNLTCGHHTNSVCFVF